MRKRALVLGGTLLLAACGSSNEGTVQTEDGEVAYDVDQSGEETNVTITAEDGSTVVANSGSGTADFPAGFSLYPGATVVSSMVINANDGAGSMITVHSSATPEDLAAHYRREAEAAGIAIGMNATVNGSVMLNGEGANGRTFSFSASPNGDGTSGQLIVGMGS
ncbi:putative periplasmic lipoprotein [Alteraurantiacibacter palmitatis]|uniref:Uncharacterized protein n=1 Tax=Alteraurantiacibacter palmitatis TaxID=2054628 RepID=A0ABV7E6D2_9SPHN